MIPRCQPRCALSPSLEYQQLVPEGQGLRGDCTRAARLRDLDQCREQVGNQNEQLFHRQLHYQSAAGIQDCPRMLKYASIAIRLFHAVHYRGSRMTC